MSGEYAYVCNSAVLDTFSTLPRREREELFRIFRSLANNPFQIGDFVRRSTSGRDLQIKRIGRWQVTFWRDDPVMEIRILELEKLLG